MFRKTKKKKKKINENETKKTDSKWRTMMKSDFNMNLVFDRKKRKNIPIEMSSCEWESSEPPSYIHTYIPMKKKKKKFHT